MSTRMLLSSHYLHDYSDFYLDLMINSLQTLYKPFWIILIEVDIRLKTELLLFLVIFFYFVLFTFWISTKSYNTCQFFLLANQRLPFLLLVDIGYSGLILYFSVCAHCLIGCYFHLRCVSPHHQCTFKEYTSLNYYGN